jgi:anti-anti-sigma factor
MPTTPEPVFHYEVQKSGDENTGAVTTITCHGRLVSETSGQIKQMVNPLIPMGRRIVLDLTDVSFLDSSGPGTLVGLKVSAVKEGFCRLELFNPSPREKKPRRLSSLTQLFSS